MATPRRTVMGPTCVSNAEKNTIQQLAQGVKIPLQKWSLWRSTYRKLQRL
jgi:hypothetical protein